MSAQLFLIGGMGAIFLALVVGIGVFVVGNGRPTALTRGIATIDQVYSPQPGPLPDQRAGGSVPFAAAAAGLGRVLTPQSAATWTQRQLDYAGNPQSWPATRVAEVQGLATVVLGLLGTLLGFLFGGVIGVVVGLPLGLVIGFVVPLLVLSDLATRRQDRIRRDLPDALDLLTLSVEAGQGFDAALAQVAAAMSGPLSAEITRMQHEMQMGRPRADAIRGMSARTSVSELRNFCTAIVQAGELGIPIANVLREQSQEMRLKRRQRADEQARKVPVKMVMPLVLCLLPALFIIVLGPAAFAIAKSGLFGH